MPRIDPEAPYPEKEQVTRLGARWDAANKVWFNPDGCSGSVGARCELV